MREVKVKGKKGTKGVSVQRYGDDLTKQTPRQTTPAIPETEVAQQMVNGVNPEVAGPKYTTMPYPADEGVASIRHQISTNNGPVTSAEPYSYISKFKPSKEKTVYLTDELPNSNHYSNDPMAVQANRLSEFPAVERHPDLSWLDSLTDKELNVLDKIINDDPLLPGEWNDIPNITPKQFESALSMYDELMPYIPQKIEKFKQLQSRANGTFRYNERIYPENYEKDAPRYTYTITPEGKHVTPNKEKINSAVTPTSNKYKNALTGAGALTGLGLAAYPFLTEKGEDENINEIPVSTLEQQYASQSIPETDSGIWGEKINKLAHLNLKDFLPNLPSIVPLSPLNRNEEALDVSSELPTNTSQATFIAPRELPAKGQTLADYNKNNPPQDIASGPRVLNAPVEKKAVTAKPVQSENRLTEANLASAMAREAVSPQVLQYGSPAYLQKNKPVDMRQWVRQKYGMSMSPAEMVQRGIMPYEYLQYW